MDELQSTAGQINISIDLLSAAKRHLNFLRVVSGLPNLHGGPMINRAIIRYRDYWMPLVANCDADGETSETSLLPPLDVQWVWHCHCLNPKAYQEFCKLRHSRIIDVPCLPDASSEVSAQERCKKIWCEIYQNEPFDIKVVQKRSLENKAEQDSRRNELSQGEESDIMSAITQQISFYTKVSQPYIYQDSFLKTAKERYRCFLLMLRKSEGKIMCIPTSDILLMWQSHMVSPVAYAQDTLGICECMGVHDLSIQTQPDSALAEAFENTARLWETVFGHPYERAGAVYQRACSAEAMTSLEKVSESSPVTINWRHRQDIDINLKYDSLIPRYVIEVCIQIRSTDQAGKFRELGDLFVRLRTMESCKLFRLDEPLEEYKKGVSWKKLWSMQCETSTMGVVLELRSRMTGCLEALGFSSLIGQATLAWEELEKEEPLALEKTVVLRNQAKILDDWRVAVSITAPVQAPYLLKSLPDRATDDAGAMLSKVMLRLNKYIPQQGRWMSRTVLNHAGKECFIIRIRVATGCWRRNVERPVGVDWDERIIHVHEGGWNYHTGSIGVTPDKIIATATPVADDLEQYKMKWSFSTGETLTIQMPIEVLEWERELRFTVKGSHLGAVRLLNGRRMQYQVPSSVPEEEEGFVTVVRYNAESQQARATALFNWKLSAMEVLPEEDVVLVLLISTATLRTVADLGGKTLGNFYSRRKRGSGRGKRDWGSVVMQGVKAPSERLLWYHNPEEVLKVKLSEENYEGVLPNGGNEQIYRGTSWLYAGGTGGLYKMSSKGSLESVERNNGEHLFGLVSLPRFGSHTKAAPHRH